MEAEAVVRKLHGGSDVGGGSRRMSSSLPGSYYCLLSWLLRLLVRLLGDREAWAVPTASHSFLEKMGPRNQQ